jgi:excisionase family DNA binding protein
MAATRHGKGVAKMGRRPARSTIGRQATRLLNLRTAAEQLATTVRTVQRLIERGVLIPVRLPGVRRTLLAEADIAKLIATSRLSSKRAADA